MVKLRKFLCGCFGFLTLVFLGVSAATVPQAMNPTDQHQLLAALQQRRLDSGYAIFVEAFVTLVLAMPLLLGVLYGIAWWTVKKGKSSARGWAIAASLVLILLSIPLLIAEFYRLLYSPGASMHFTIFVVLVLALGIAGLVAFGPHSAKAPINPPKPTRIAGDGTSRFLDVLALLVGIGGIVVGNNLWYRWGDAQDLPIMHGYTPFLWIIIAALITTALHELGHATVGLAFGMKLRAFIVGPFQWRIRDGSWKFQFLPAKFLGAGGATAVVPTNPKHSGWNDICMIAAGPLASLLSGLIALEIALSAKGSLYAQYWELFAMIATFSLVGIAVNLIPFRPESSYSDGAQIYQLLRGGPWADRKSTRLNSSH